MAVCKTVGIAYVGSNPTPATSKINRRSLGYSLVDLKAERSRQSDRP